MAYKSNNVAETPPPSLLDHVPMRSIYNNSDAIDSEIKSTVAHSGNFELSYTHSAFAQVVHRGSVGRSKGLTGAAKGVSKKNRCERIFIWTVPVT